MPSGNLLSLGTIMAPTFGDQKLIREIEVQNAYLSFNVVKTVLQSDRIGGLHCLFNTSLFTHEVIVESGVREVKVAIENACFSLKPIAQEEMESLLHTFDMTDTNLCNSYERVARLLMTERISFGRIVSLFFFTYTLCKRLHEDSRPRLIESVVNWLTVFLNETVSPWLVGQHQGKWVSHHSYCS